MQRSQRRVAAILSAKHQPEPRTGDSYEEADDDHQPIAAECCPNPYLLTFG